MNAENEHILHIAAEHFISEVLIEYILLSLALLVLIFNNNIAAEQEFLHQSLQSVSVDYG